MKTGYHVRDTLVNFSALEALPLARRERIKKLTAEYNSLGYIDARTQIGPDQVRRMSSKQHDKLSSIALRVFAIEDEVKQLLKPDTQLATEQLKANNEKHQAAIRQVENYIRTLETCCASKLASPRMNATRKSYDDAKKQLLGLQSNNL